MTRIVRDLTVLPASGTYHAEAGPHLPSLEGWKAEST